MACKQYHIMMFPWLAFGHMIPYLELSKILAAKRILISYISTPRNLQRLPPIPSNLQTKINFVEIPLPQVEGLPGNCEATIDIPDASGVSSGQRLAKILEDCSFVAFRSCDEFEGEYLSVVRELYQKPVFPIGVLPPVPFVWILRKPQEVHSSDLLPPGFANGTSSQGIVVQEWAPQLEILAHSAIGGCLFHSGWGTIVESLGFGHPLILLPMVADQGLNAKLLVEKEVGYEVPRNKDGSFSHEAVARSLRLVMVAPEGDKFRSKAAEMRRIFSNQESEECYINKFIEHLQKYRDIKEK